MMTQRLYFNDPYRTNFEATVINRTEVDGKPGLVLDRTCFYPAGGGQKCDMGFLNDVPVVDGLEHRGEILHLVSDEIGADKVRGRIDGSGGSTLCNSIRANTCYHRVC
jgi:alanyl-tRNA synthetase